MNINKQTGDFWNKKKSALSWWHFPFFIKHINKRICGIPYETMSEGLLHRLKEKYSNKIPFRNGISIGCGNASKEIFLLRNNIVSNFQCYELSENRIISAKKNAITHNVENRIKFINKSPIDETDFIEEFDFFHWNNSLHHMLDTEKAIKFSYERLTKGGIFYMDDYVGPTRFQWSAEMLDIANKVREILPDKYFSTEKKINKKLFPPKLDWFEKNDPSEAADSENIIPSIKKYFPEAYIKNTGGVIYHLALSKLLENFNMEKDRLFLESLMIIDDMLSDYDITHYAVAIAEKR
jgi:SAM-dependent methyltransferase